MVSKNGKMSMNKNNRYLHFSLGDELFAIPLLMVKEVIAFPEITPVPHTPAYFKGIMNLRGQIISILDLREKLGFTHVFNSETVVVICEIEDLSIGVVVDSVLSVVALSDEDILSRPDVLESKAADSITGVFKKDEKLVLLLDLGKSLSLVEGQFVRSQMKQAA